MEMTQAQARALKIYCESANINNGYIPKTFEEIANDLRAEGLQGSSSSVQRWSVKFDFKSHLVAKLQLAVIEDKDKTLETVALRSLDTKKTVDILRNNELTSDGYEVLEIFVSEVLEKLDKKEGVSLKVIQLVKDIVLLTSGREDKLLDRFAGAGNETLSSEEIMKEFETIDLDIEEE